MDLKEPVLILMLGGLLPLLAALGLILAGIVLLLHPAQGWALLPAGFALALGLGWLSRLFQSFPRPGQSPLQPEQAPLLFAAIRELQQGIAGPSRSSLALERGYGVDLLMLPTLGGLGWSRPHHSLGIFTLMYFNEREFLACVSWDLSYWSDQHGWLNLQAKRLLEFWHRLKHLTETTLAAGPAPGRGYYGSLIHLRDTSLQAFARRFLAWSAGFQQRAIGSADTACRHNFGAQCHGRALIKQALIKPLLDRYLFQVWQERRNQGQPWPQAPLAATQAFLHQPPPGQAELDLRAALLGLIPGQPAYLEARLAALAVPVQLPLAPGRSALERLLPADLIVELEQAWNRDLAALDQRQAEQRAQDDQRFQALETAAQTRPLTASERLECARLAEFREPPAALAARLQQVAQDLPRNGWAQLLLAQFHLRQGDPAAGQQALASLRALSPLNAGVADDLLAEHLDRTGDHEGASRVRLAALERQPELLAAEAERAQFSLRDPMLPHGLSTASLEPLLRQIRTTPGVARAYLVQKRLQHLPQSRAFLLVVEPIGPHPLSEPLRQVLLDRLARDLPWPDGAKGFILVYPGPAGWPLWRLRRIAHSRIYPCPLLPSPLARLALLRGNRTAKPSPGSEALPGPGSVDPDQVSSA